MFSIYQSVWLAAYWFISNNKDPPVFELGTADASELNPCLEQGLLIATQTKNVYQWEYHPRRPATRAGEVYRRFIPELGVCFFLSSLSDSDGQIQHPCIAADNELHYHIHVRSY
jgi:hypothetical protein